jgi:hypothetical protein
MCCYYIMQDVFLYPARRSSFLPRYETREKGTSAGTRDLHPHFSG